MLAIKKTIVGSLPRAAAYAVGLQQERLIGKSLLRQMRDKMMPSHPREDGPPCPPPSPGNRSCVEYAFNIIAAGKVPQQSSLPRRPLIHSFSIMYFHSTWKNTDSLSKRREIKRGGLHMIPNVGFDLTISTSETIYITSILYDLTEGTSISSLYNICTAVLMYPSLKTRINAD